MDLIVRLDGVIAELLKFLDTEVGAGKYVVALTADHGVTPLPERVNLLGRDLGAGRFKDREITEAVEQALVAKFGAAGEGQFWAARDSYGIRFTRAVLEARHVAVQDAAAVAKQILLKQPQIAEVYTAAEVQAAVPSDQTVIGRVALSYHRERSQDVLFVLQPFIVDRSPAGTNHGGPYDHDDHVPLCFFGAGVKHGLRTERVGVDQVAPTLAGLLQIPPPPAARGTPLF
jgi:arylsulfatase A-like enzyme